MLYFYYVTIDGQELVPKRAYNLDVEAYIDFLKSGVEAYNKTK